MTTRRVIFFKERPKQGQFILQRLSELHRNQSWLSKQTGATSAQISNFINGKQIPSLKTAVNIARVLKVSVDDFSTSFM